MFSNSPSLISQSPYVDEIIPFDERTKSLFRRAKTLDTLFEELKNAGFKQIQEETFTFEYLQNSVTAEDWIYLIENRVWTQFSEENTIRESDQFSNGSQANDNKMLRRINDIQFLYFFLLQN